MPVHSGRPPLEFEPVFGAFERMAADIRSSQAALEEARRRTAAVLATVATGVVGIDPRGRVLIANRQAVDLLGTPLREGEPFLDSLSVEWVPLADAVRRFLRDPGVDGSAELEVGGRRLTLQLASLGPEVHGVVMALNDVTEVSRAERVLAWGEMARQVAHEIKNPLTPMRLGMQHLRRVYRDRRDEFDRTLEETATRILGEIDRLDTIARAFSRFAAPADPGQPLDRIDLAVAVGEVVELYRLAEEGCDVRLEVAPNAAGAARADEVKEVVVNLLENARNAGARVVRISVGPGAHPGRGRWSRHSCRSPAASVRAALLDHNEWIGTGSGNCAAAGGELGRASRGGERSGAGDGGFGTAAVLSQRGIVLARSAWAIASTSSWVEARRSSRTAACI